MTYVAPVIPDNAPFDSQQRAWLNGLLAGLLGPGASAVPLNGIALPLGDVPAAVDNADDPHEEFPWHDPSLDLDARMALAEGKPLKRRLMAAMAQMDCGQCGYECRIYAEAIAAGTETSLGKCQPGGKATARMLRSCSNPATCRPRLSRWRRRRPRCPAAPRCATPCCCRRRG